MTIKIFKDVLMYGVVCMLSAFFCYTLIVLKMQQSKDVWYMFLAIQIVLANIGSVLDIVYFKFWPRSEWVLEQKEQGISMTVLLQYFKWIGFSTVLGSFLGVALANAFHGAF